jgi:hypothetical protein
VSYRKYVRSLKLKKIHIYRFVTGDNAATISLTDAVVSIRQKVP